MSGNRTKTSRRAFVLNGGAVLGAGVATTVGATAVGASPENPLSPEEELKQLRARLAGLEDRDAIRQLHLAFTSLIESQRYEAAAELFDEHARLELSGVSASGKPAIRALFGEQYRNQNAATLHGAYRQSSRQQADEVKLSDDRLRAVATFHCEVELCAPLQADCTAAQMARLQGNMADRRWESGRFEASYVKTLGQWKVTSLSYVGTA